MNALLALRERYLAGEIAKADFIEQMHAHHAQLYQYAELLRDCEVSAIQITADAVVMASRDGIKFLIDPVDRRSPPVEALNFAAYEADDAEVFWSLCEPEQTILDVGANIGWYALHVAERLPTATVHAFEPVPSTFTYLKRNCDANDLSNVVLHNFGLADRDGPATFFVYPEGPGGASLADTSGRATVTKIEGSVRRLDALGLKPDVIKIDVEGAEVAVLRGGVATLRQHRPAVFIEMLRKWTAAHGTHPNETIALMQSLGYECCAGRTLRRVVTMTDDEVATNFVFLHRERHADRIRRSASSQ
jgi:FkbM family methyltransferase